MAIDSERFTRLFEETFPGLCRFLGGMVGDPALAEDLAQEVFLRILRVGLDALQEGEERFWIYRVGRNLAVNELSRRKTGKRVQAGIEATPGARGEAAGSPLERKEELQLLLTVLDRIPPRQRAALLLREHGSLNYREIAGILGVSEGAVKIDVFRARSFLRRGLPRSAGARNDEVDHGLP